VLDAQTGEILALANVPSYVPTKRRNLTGAQLRNRALTDTFEPGSTMKPFVVAKALQEGLIRPTSIIATNPGRMQIDGSTITDAHPHGDLTVSEVVQKSSNVGTVKIAMMMQPKDMWEVFSAVGFGHKPQIGFPGAVTGRLRPYKNWRRIEYATMSYGYGLSASLLQIAQAYTVFARDGELAPLSLIKREAPSENAPAPVMAMAGMGSAVAATAMPDGVLPVNGPRVFSPQVVEQVRKMLALACAEGGTAPLAQTVGYSVGGKTGTAHKQEGRGYAADKYRSWFVGISPISKPRIVVAVMVDEPSKGVYYGGLVAAPVFSQVVQYTLNRLGVMPDLQVQPRITAVPSVQESF
jgi:cell division protein FtsI (penicillin-binding protein 3)